MCFLCLSKWVRWVVTFSPTGGGHLYSIGYFCGASVLVVVLDRLITRYLAWTANAITNLHLAPCLPAETQIAVIQL